MKGNFGYFFREGSRNMFSHGFMSFAAIGITVACLLIMGTFSLVAYNADYNLKNLQKENAILAFIDESLSDEDARALQSKVEAVSNVGDVTFVSREEARDSYVAQYSAAVGKDHTRTYTGNAILYWYDGGDMANAAVANADAQPPLDPPVRQRGWYLDRTELDLAAECRDDPIIPARRPGRRTGQQVIESAKTCDGGIALYAGLSLLSLTGSAVLGKKKF